MKEGLAKNHIATYHKMLRQEIPLKTIARHLHTRVDVLMKFTPEKVEVAKKKAKAVEVAITEERNENQRKADILTATATNIMNGKVTL